MENSRFRPKIKKTLKMRVIQEPKKILQSHDAISLFLDFDGTLVDIAETPESVSISKATKVLLQQLNSKSMFSLAIITGRPICEIDNFLSPLLLSMAGKHGAEIRNGPKVINMNTQTDLKHIVKKFENLAKNHPETFIENKGSNIAFHYRNSDLTDDKVQRWAKQNISVKNNLKCIFGKKVCEVLPILINKGVAIKYFMAREPFKNGFPIFIGDDTTDEDGFMFINQAGGLSIKVGESERSQAKFYLKDVNETRFWLTDFL